MTNDENKIPVHFVEIHPATGREGSNFRAKTDWEMLRDFFTLTGGSIFYCISAVLVAYGVVKLLGPVLSDTETIMAAMPCIGTLAVYELALLGVLALIISRKVVDDAISVTLIVALYMVATSMATGSVAERDIRFAVYPALFGTILGAGKFYVLRRWIRIPFGNLSMVGLSGLIAINYFGPILMAHSIQTDTANELGRRGIWFLVWTAMLLASGLVWYERLPDQSETAKGKSVALLQSPMMVCILALVLLAASGVHQYASAYMFAIAKPIGDFLGAIGLGTLLLLEILRLSKLPFGPIQIGVSCLPLIAMGYAIHQKQIAANGSMGLDILVWPPVFFPLIGIGYLIVANRTGWRNLHFVVYGCALGTVLTAGYSPLRPWDLNTTAFGVTLVLSLMAYGIVTWKPPICFLAVAILTLGLSQISSFTMGVVAWQLTPYGALAGVIGLGCTALYLIFLKQFHVAGRILGFVGVSAFLYDFLPSSWNSRYVLVLAIAVMIAAIVWLRTRDRLVFLFLSLPFGARMYILAKQIAEWRFVILGFLVLAAGAVLSIQKSKQKSRIEEFSNPTSIPSGGQDL